MEKYKKNINILLLSIIIFLELVILILIVTHKNVVVLNEDKVIDENVFFFGDSITDYYDLNKYYDNYVINSGISGNQTPDLLNRMDDVYKYNPSKVFLLIGINDLHANRSVDEIADNIENIILEIKENRKYTQIYVESVYPINREIMTNPSVYVGNATNEDVKLLNKKIKNICNQLDVTYIDLYNKLIDENGNLKQSYTKEGLHISDEGYIEITNILKQYINE